MSKAFDDATEAHIANLQGTLLFADKLSRNRAILNWYAKGTPVRTIARMFGVSHGTISHIAHRYTTPRDGKRGYNPAAEAAAREWLAQHEPRPLSMAKVGARHGVNRFMVAGYVKRIRTNEQKRVHSR